VRRDLTAQRDEIEEALRHSQTEFARMVGDLLDVRMKHFEGLVMAALRKNNEQAKRGVALPSSSSPCEVLRAVSEPSSEGLYDNNCHASTPIYDARLM